MNDIGKIGGNKRSKRPNLHSVAQAAGVSVATASQALRDTGRLSPDTRQRVIGTARKLNYIRDARAASMRSGRVTEIGLVIHGIANPFNAEVISGVSETLESEGYFVSILDSRNDAGREARNLEAFIAGARGGLIWVPTDDALAESPAMLATHGIPAVTFLRPIAGSPLDHIGIENRKAVFEGTQYLKSLGHVHIAYFGGVGDSHVRNRRIRGYRDAMGDSETIIWDCTDTKAAGHDAAMELFARHGEVTALVCNGDMVALGACLAIARRGMQPGREISVIGFDDIADAALATPPLTTMAISPVDLGRRLAGTLIDRINNPGADHVNISVAAELVIRGTTGKPC